MKKFKFFACLLGLFAIPALTIAPALSAPAFAADNDICNLANVSDEVKAASGCHSAGNLPELKDVITSIINGIIAVVGLIAVIYVVYGGIQYMTSSGDTTKTTKARNTIFYALLGIVICALSFMAVNFVIKNIIGGDVDSTGGVELVGDRDDEIENMITSIINGIISVMGIVCVAFILVGGYNYMTSEGDAQKVEKAKKTILYAGIGLIICALAFAITNFVIYNIIGGNKITGGGGGSGGSGGGGGDDH